MHCGVCGAMSAEEAYMIQIRPRGDDWRDWVIRADHDVAIRECADVLSCFDDGYQARVIVMTGATAMDRLDP